MQQGKGKIGGFAGQNRGSIENCFSVTSVRGRKSLSGGFVADNSGQIAHCYAWSPLRSLTGGFSGTDTVKTTDCYFLHAADKADRSAFARLTDTEKGQRVQHLSDAGDYEKLGFNTADIWEMGDAKIPLQFIADTWFFSVPEEENTRVLTISNADELRRFANRVNKGDNASRRAHVRLTADIDLGGKEWTPIGSSKACSFDGIFDGNGFFVQNFIIKNKQTALPGFFGFLRGSVYNLIVDCAVSGRDCLGGLAARNEGGIIGCCGAIADVKCRSGAAGGLVGINNGRIFESYAAGKAAAGVLALPLVNGILGGLALAMLATALLLGRALQPKTEKIPIFAPVPYEEDQLPIEGEKVAPKTDGNFVSFQFEEEITVDLATGQCTFNFQNPGDSNHNIVVQLQFTDAQAIRVMGSTGRTPEAQAALEAAPDYDPETYRTVLAESGAIRPGHALADLRLIGQPNGATIPPGAYNAIIYLIFYDIETNNRAMLESQLPVAITVH